MEVFRPEISVPKVAKKQIIWAISSSNETTGHSQT